MTKTSFAHGQLNALVNRIERLEEERKNIGTDIKEVYAEAKGNGFDVKILRKVIAKRKKDTAERQEEEAMIDVYMASLGGIDKPVQSIIRKDGVKVTFERARETHDPVTGEIAEIQEVGSHEPPLDGRGETSAASDAPAEPIPELPHQDTPMDDVAQAGATLIDQPEPSPAIVPVSVEESEAPAVSFDDDLAIPDFLKRAKPQYTAGDMLAAG